MNDIVTPETMLGKYEPILFYDVQRMDSIVFR